MWLLSKAKPSISGKSTLISTGGEKRKEHGNESDRNKKVKNFDDERRESLEVPEQKRKTEHKETSSKKAKAWHIFSLLLTSSHSPFLADIHSQAEKFPT